MEASSRGFSSSSPSSPHSRLHPGSLLPGILEEEERQGNEEEEGQQRAASCEP